MYVIASHAGGLEITGPVSDWITTITYYGSVGITIALTQAAVALVGGMAGKGSFSMVTVCI